MLKQAHLPTSGSTLRTYAFGQAYRLTEEPPLSRDPFEVVDWLDVEKHARYRPSQFTTYCNVYAHDYCTARDVYLPRVWWTPTAVALLGNGHKVDAVYGTTVFELSANGLYRWLESPASEFFGWRRIGTPKDFRPMSEVQALANDGEVVVICAKRIDENASGHISCVLPESSRCEAMADADGRIIRPVQSQAGGKNVKLGTLTQWWLGKEMAAWGVWACPMPKVG